MVWVANELRVTAALGEAVEAPSHIHSTRERGRALAYLLTPKSPLQSSSPETLQSGKYSSKYFKDFESWNCSSCDFSIGWGKSNTCPCYHPAGRQLWLISRMTAKGRVWRTLCVQSSVAQSTLPTALQQFCQLYHTWPILGQLPTTNRKTSISRGTERTGQILLGSGVLGTRVRHTEDWKVTEAASVVSHHNYANSDWNLLIFYTC